MQGTENGSSFKVMFEFLKGGFEHWKKTGQKESEGEDPRKGWMVRQGMFGESTKDRENSV